MIQPTKQNDNVIVLGASFERETGGQVIDTLNKDNIINSNLAAAAIINHQSLIEVTSLAMLIINDPFGYKNMTDSSDKTIVSSIIVAAIQRLSYTFTPINIFLYFKVWDKYLPSTDGKYLCSFFDTNTSNWNESGCTLPQYNAAYDRYECSCNHLTTFALVWLPNLPQLNYFTSQDIASLVFLSISILCFIAVIIHSFLIRFHNPMMSFTARDLLPLVSSASTTMLFIFYIALSMTVYTRISSASSTPTPCFTSASVLMFFVYFFLIFMFCAKTSVGYFNYLRFIHLFPDPSFRKLFVLLIISFFISLALTVFAAGLNSNASYNITQLQGNKLCWFTRDVICYFVAIPVGIFLLLNLITVILVAIYMINHNEYAEKSYPSYEQMKRCVFILLASSMTQSVGWLFVSFISIVDLTAADVLGWFFAIFNGLEGLWTILLYISIRSQHIDRENDVHAYEEITETTTPLPE